MTHLSHTIVQAFKGSDEVATRQISREQVLNWMRAEDIEALGALSKFIREASYFAKISPPISFEEYKDFFLHYYRKCIIENPDNDWSDNRYVAGHDFMTWFLWMWDNEEIPRSALAQIRDWLGDLYKSGDDEIRLAIVNAILEHLFEKHAISEYFKIWQSDPILNVAYSEAQSWVEGLNKMGIAPPMR